MITTSLSPESGLFEATASGMVTAADYAENLVPALEAAIAARGPIPMLYHFSPAFEGFSPGAMWQDTRLGLHHLHDIARLAVVTDNALLHAAVTAFAWMIPAPTRVFPEAALTEARTWLAAPT
ncbi:STAS/SEC14 domain-containing protein [Pseudooceanicola sp. CBS1P-1]|uniref:STAS/SEC14 domain-containing protein n=1 Tax=Pseudooceanicola albus TaxID=2692189 RepID=A0A6L7G288_9RHOB|nr:MULTISPECIES: STAS/SEC14 domain-containing protein [Pseudooceanicola]MBT9383692.1 STAS/SEC14 domain-containing protein [Pseudooceanicola endophyticus]MXN17546.1 STAS/SEC14 domain-containing protein [Pseudooceanicola albus]